MTPEEIASAVESGALPDHAVLDDLDRQQRDDVIDRLLMNPAGRRWMRLYPHLDSDLADRLMQYEEDFRQKRRDVSLAMIVDQAADETLMRHASAVASGPAASNLWVRFDHDPDRIARIATTIVSSMDQDAAEATIALLVLDPLDPYRLGATREDIATAGLRSPFSSVRGLSAEYLAVHGPAAIIESFDSLIRDDDQRVRGVAWSTGLRGNRSWTRERAIDLLGDESVPIEIRRSALVAVGTSLPTAQMIDILTYLVVHPDERLASDAADLLYNQHRNPITAEAARLSPHERVREIAEVLLDPLRGSPAAGGSRPGDPTRSTSDIYESMVRQLEEREQQLRGHPDSDQQG